MNITVKFYELEENAAFRRDYKVPQPGVNRNTVT